MNLSLGNSSDLFWSKIIFSFAISIVIFFDSKFCKRTKVNSLNSSSVNNFWLLLFELVLITSILLLLLSLLSILFVLISLLLFSSSKLLLLFVELIITPSLLILLVILCSLSSSLLLSILISLLLFSFIFFCGVSLISLFCSDKGLILLILFKLSFFDSSSFVDSILFLFVSLSIFILFIVFSFSFSFILIFDGVSFSVSSFFIWLLFNSVFLLFSELSKSLTSKGSEPISFNCSLSVKIFSLYFFILLFDSSINEFNKRIFEFTFSKGSLSIFVKFL